MSPIAFVSYETNNKNAPQDCPTGVSFAHVAKHPILAVLSVTFLALLYASGASAEGCTCDNTESRVCVNGTTGSGPGAGLQTFSLELLSSAVNQDAGKREFVYKLCYNLPSDPFCPTGTHNKDLSHVDLPIGDITSCAGSQVSVEVSLWSPSVKKCTVSTTDPSCGATSFKMIKCEPKDTFDVGDCFQFTVSIGGETTQVSPGPIYTITKAGPDCAQACILGPSCTDCSPPQPGDVGEFTRSPGFYATHPRITSLYLPIDACNMTFDHFAADPQPKSVSQALCISAKPRVSKARYNLDTLLRQLVAAGLNVKVTEENGGSITQEHLDRINECNAICTAASTDATVVSNCVSDLGDFNNDIDTLVPTPNDFARPGRADPTQCQLSRGDAFLFFL
jgi:hypothetical protein